MTNLVSKCCKAEVIYHDRPYLFRDKPKLTSCSKCHKPCDTVEKEELSQAEIDLIMEQEIYKGLIEYLKKMFHRNPKEYELMLKDDSEMGLIGLGAIYKNPKKEIPPQSEEEWIESKMKEFDNNTFHWQNESGMVKWSEVRLFLLSALREKRGK